MKIKDLLLESYKDALGKFSNDAPTHEVQSYLDKFRQLAKKNIIQGSDKDIGKWMKGLWVDFKDMVDDKSKAKSKSQIKKEKKKGSVVVYEDDDKMVIVPFTKDASCFYGRQTKWCTAATESNNEFNKNFFKDNTTLFYVLLSDGTKYAAVYTAQTNRFEFFDNLNEIMNSELFTKETGIELDQLRDSYVKHKRVIEKFRTNGLRKLGDEAVESADPIKVYIHVWMGRFPKGNISSQTMLNFHLFMPTIY